MDISSDLASVQLRIAQITGTAPPVTASPVTASPVTASPQTGAGMPFGDVLAAALAGQSSAAPPALVAPVEGAVTSGFGERANPLGPGSEFHPGIDIAAEQGTPIRAAMAGRVVAAGPDAGYGNLVTIDDGNGMTTRYAHCSDILAQIGQIVAPGDVIGTVGMTGRATGPHLHFEVRQNDRPVDPLPYLQAAR